MVSEESPTAIRVTDSNLMKHFGRGLIFKLGAVLLLLLFIKLLMIGIGIYSARHLKGDAKAINYAGSERMRSYKLSFLIGKYLKEDGEKKLERRRQIDAEVERFEQILRRLREGEGREGGNIYDEPRLIMGLMEIHPVFKKLLRLPGIYEPDLKVQIEAVNDNWRRDIRPVIRKILDAEDIAEALETHKIFDERIPSFVDSVDGFVTHLEDSSNRKVMVFYGMQYLFLTLTVAVTVVALYLIFAVTKKSVEGLMDGIRSMTAGDFSKRVKVISDDEMGELANGFNFMAQKLEESYSNLERKVVEKTTALEERNRELSILYDMAASLNQSLPLEDILKGYLEKLLGHLAVDCGSIRLVDEDNALRLAASVGLPERFSKASIAVGECLCGASAKASEAGFWDISSPPEGMVLRECMEFGYRTVAVIPISYKDRLLGVTNLFQKEKREFSSQEKRLLASLSNHIGVAIEYYNLNAKAKKLAIMEERNILAHELHDSIAQSLAYLNIQTSLMEDSMKRDAGEEATENLRRIREGIHKGYNDVRELLSHFRTQMDEEGLMDALESHLTKFSLSTGIETAFDAGSRGLSLSPEAEVHVFHIIQEALANVRKHSRAKVVKVLISDGWPLLASVEDNGIGFDLDSLEGGGVHHMGLSIMRERASKVGGALNVISGAGRGTRIELTISREAR